MALSLATNCFAQGPPPAKPTAPPPELPTAVESPDVIAFRHMVAAQANEQQKAQFREVARTMREAIAQATRLHAAATAGTDQEEISRSATAARDAVYDAQHENFVLLKSLSDLQEAELKKLTTKVRKANAQAGKASDLVNDELSRSRPDLHRIASASGTLEKDLKAMQSDQRSLAREMGIKGTHLDDAEPGQDR